MHFMSDFNQLLPQKDVCYAKRKAENSRDKIFYKVIIVRVLYS